MPRATQPFTPDQDLEARRNWAGPVIAGVLTADLAAFCQSGVSIVLAATASDGLPVAGKGLSAIISAEGRVRVYLREGINLPLLAALEAGSGIAATFTEPRTHRSIQMKSKATTRLAVEPADLPEVARQIRHFGNELVDMSYTHRLVEHYCMYTDEELIVIEYLPSDAFVQTPGPGAGSQLGS
jgi:hypothetical protein